MQLTESKSWKERAMSKAKKERIEQEDSHE